MKRFATILGHERPLAALDGLLERGRLPHAMLFHGPEGVGKASVARLLGRALVCRELGCAACDDCRLFDAGNHPDFVHVKLELRKDSKTEYRKQIVVEQIRQLSTLVGLAPRLGARRVFLIDPADKSPRSTSSAWMPDTRRCRPAGRRSGTAARPWRDGRP